MEKNDINLIELTGGGTIGNAREIQELFLNALSEGKPVVLEMSKLEDMDVTFVQLLVAFLDKAVAKGIKVDLKGVFQEKIGQAMDLVGFEYTLSEGMISIEG